MTRYESFRPPVERQASDTHETRIKRLESERERLSLLPDHEDRIAQLERKIGLLADRLIALEEPEVAFARLNDLEAVDDQVNARISNVRDGLAAAIDDLSSRLRVLEKQSHAPPPQPPQEPERNTALSALASTARHRDEPEADREDGAVGGDEATMVAEEALDYGFDCGVAADRRDLRLTTVQYARRIRHYAAKEMELVRSAAGKTRDKIPSDGLASYESGWRQGIRDCMRWLDERGAELRGKP